MSPRTYRNFDIKCARLIAMGRERKQRLLLTVTIPIVLLYSGILFAEGPVTDQGSEEASEAPAADALPETIMEVPEPELGSQTEELQINDAELEQTKASKTLHRYTIGSIQKKRLLGDVQKKAQQQGLFGRRLAAHIRGAKMVIDRIGSETFSIELKANGKLLFVQGGRTKIMTYRIKGNLLEVEKGDGSFRRLARFNGNKSTLSLLDPVYGKEIVAVLQK